MYQVSQAFLQAIENGDESIHHIRCHIKQVDGSEYTLEDEELTGSPAINRQCVEQAEAFAFGQMYVGTAEVTVNMPGAEVNRFRGGELSLEFGIDVEGSDEPEWIPLGVWDITDPVREAGETIRIKAIDHLGRLRCQRTYTGTGILYLETVMSQIEKAAGVEFAQTPADVLALIGKPALTVWRIELADTCWEDVRQIAEIIGGFAYADRSGRIAFRRFSQDPCLTIPAGRRFSAQRAEYQFGLQAVRYTDGNGYSSARPGYGFEVGSTVEFTENGYIHAVDETNYVEEFDKWIGPILSAFQGVNWTPGTVEYYGNPALDIGDMVTVMGGIAAQPVKFLICAETWQFRGPQTLIASGHSEGGTSSSSGSSGTSAVSAVNVTVTKVIGTVELSKYPGAVSGEFTAARGGYSCKVQSCCFINAGITLLADEDCVFGAKVWHDGVAQEFWPQMTVRAGEYGTLNITVPVTADPGTHTVEVAVRGEGTVTDISAYIWGQELTAESPQYTSDSDYTYTVSGGKATVTGYVGSSLFPDIPSKLGGGATSVIGAEAFTDSEITSVYIPEGVTEIQSVSGSLPAEYQQVEYLESSGTQYIITNFVYDFGAGAAWQDKYDVSIKCSSSDNYSICGAIYGGERAFNLTGDNNIYKFYAYSNGSSVATNIPVELTPHVWEYQDYSLYCDGALLGEAGKRSPGGGGRAIYLFAMNSGNSPVEMGGTKRIYSFSAKRNGNMLCNMVPCYRKNDGKPGMYDTVTGEFYTNSGTGEFLYGGTSGDGTGAFMNAHALTDVYIPRTCQVIGEWAFTNTALKKVLIPAYCTYYETSFPPDCEVQFYGGGGDYGQLFDGDGYAVLDGDGARIYIGE